MKPRNRVRRRATRRAILAGALPALVATLVAVGAQAGTAVQKPAPPFAPVPGPREPVEPGPGTVNGIPVPNAGGRPAVLSAERQQQLVASAEQAAAKGAIAPTPPKPLGPGGRIVGSQPPVKDNAPAGPPNDRKPRLIPAPQSVVSPKSSIGSIYGSTQVDDRGGCGSFGANESSVAQSTVNPNIVVVVFQMYRNPDGSCGDSHDFIAYSHDGGQHWVQTSPSTLTLPSSGDAGVTYDAKHGLFVHSFIEFNRGNGALGRIAGEVSADGATWSRDVTFDSNSASVGVDKPMITADDNPASPHFGRVAVTWTEFRSSGQFYFADYTDDGGVTWHTGDTSINQVSHNCGNGTSPAFDPSGGLMVAWWDCTGGTARLFDEYSADGGATWSTGTDVAISAIDSIENPVSGACFLNGGGSSFRCDSFPSLAGSPNVGGVGTHAFAVVWSDVDSIAQGGVTHNVAEIHELSTVDATISSATWGAPNFGSFANFGDKFFPWASFSVTDGRLNIGYLSRENDASSGNPQGKRFNQHETEAGSLCRLRGGCGGDQFISYTVDSTLSDPGSSAFIGDYDGSGSYDRNFDSFPSWTDVRNGTNDVRTAQLCYLDCYSFLSPFTPVAVSRAAGSTFSDFWQIDTDPQFGGSGANFWNAVGLREGADGTTVDDDTFLAPNRYYDTALASSSFGEPFSDYVLTNNNSGFAPEAPYYPQVHSFSTAGGSYSIEWAAGHIVLGTSLGDSIPAGGVVRVYDSFLTTGTTYHLGLRPAGGNTSIYTFALHSASNGNEQGAPGAAAAARRTPAGQPSFLTFATGAQPSQFDGIVVQNDNGGSGSYTLYRDAQLPAATVSIDSGDTFTKKANVKLTISGTNPTAGDPVLDMRIALDGVTFGAWQPFSTTANVTLPAGDGTKTVAVEVRNGAGGVSPDATDTIQLDTTAPTVTVTAPAPFQKSTSFTLKWSAADMGSGVASYDVQERVATPTAGFGAWTTILSATASMQKKLTGNAGETLQFRVRARDTLGNVSSYAGPVTTAIPVDDPSLGVASGSWNRLTGQSGTYLTTISRSSATGDALSTGTVTAKQIAVLVTKKSGAGTIEIRWNGVLKATVSLSAGSTKKEQFVKLPPFGSAQTAAVTITHSAGGAVDIDGVALSRT